MKQTIGFYEFREAFRSLRPDNFSNEGVCALFDYLEELEEDTGEEIELDVIALCCDYSEASWGDIARDYSIELTDPDDADLVAQEVREHLEERSIIVGEVPGGCVYLNF